MEAFEQQYSLYHLNLKFDLDIKESLLLTGWAVTVQHTTFTLSETCQEPLGDHSHHTC